MGFFDMLFGGSPAEKVQTENIPWIDLNDIAQLDKIVEQSKTRPQLIFKHSTRCGISRMVISHFKKDYKLSEDEADLYYLDLLSHRDISNTIAEQFKVIHESPQLIVIKSGEVVTHASHGSINDLELSKVAG
ncbi:bacillithiol system redox-active protein YtxJ [Subsaxibacter sp. CAU 1640]|uniref:bacillithiol system redox-active protein YtxJ n=1 Tax=Subsaxibacter sp. CAU 1640 TaxID=2933271 RepID=UPI0020031FCD|nr:bacillithiol system redox-active protein YtxJ [Subsaxibacter sp. CAU 1640]MCK7591222.1 bacillithiol system redox-active protein YtxJ [Subsaxibacter sp. CAU 1640]